MLGALKDQYRISEAATKWGVGYGEGAAYAKQAAKQQPIYAEKSKKTKQPACNVALADFMHPPEILGFDLASYTGKAGQAIRVQAHDDVMVQRVSIVIADADKQIVEQGLATGDASGLGWMYITTENCPTKMATIVAHVEDLTGHWVEREEDKE